MKKLIFYVAVISSVLLLGCKAEREELLLYCGAGIRPPVDELAETFEREYGVKIALDYAGSEVLLSKIKLARQGDLYMPGDKHYVEQAAQAGMVLFQRPVCYWIPTILVQKGNPKQINGLEDLLKPGIKLGLGDPAACAIGRTSKQVFAKNNIDWQDVEKQVAFHSLTVNELGMQIQAKSLDAVIVWDAMAKYYSEHGTEVPIPKEKNVISNIDVGVLKFSKDPKTAEKFVDFLVSEQGREIFEKYGYRTTAP